MDDPAAIVPGFDWTDCTTFASHIRRLLDNILGRLTKFGQNAEEPQTAPTLFDSPVDEPMAMCSLHGLHLLTATLKPSVLL